MPGDIARFVGTKQYMSQESELIPKTYSESLEPITPSMIFSKTGVEPEVSYIRSFPPQQAVVYPNQPQHPRFHNHYALGTSQTDPMLLTARIWCYRIEAIPWMYPSRARSSPTNRCVLSASTLDQENPFDALAAHGHPLALLIQADPSYRNAR